MKASRNTHLLGSGYQAFAQTEKWETRRCEGQEDLYLPCAQCHVWGIRLDQGPKCVEHLWAFLSATEQTRAQQFYAQLDAQRFVVARGLLRVLLGHYTGFHPAQIKLDYTKSGKPGLAGSHIQFSKSTSANLGLLAFCRGGEVGVDVEMRRNLGDIDHLKKQLFSMDEQREIDAAPFDQQLALFFRGWTRKEALLKALGTGLAIHPGRVKVPLADAPESKATLDVMSDLGPVDWMLRSWEPLPRYQAALAIHAKSPSVSFYRLVAE